MPILRLNAYDCETSVTSGIEFVTYLMRIGGTEPDPFPGERVEFTKTAQAQMIFDDYCERVRAHVGPLAPIGPGEKGKGVHVSAHMVRNSGRAPSGFRKLKFSCDIIPKREAAAA